MPRDVAIAGLEEDGFQLSVAIKIAKAHAGVAEAGGINFICKVKWTCHAYLFIE